MAKVAFIGDAHLGSSKNLDASVYENRKHYLDEWKNVQETIQYINHHSPDYVIWLGDVLEWYSDENLEFALNILSELKAPWKITPGNHDYQLPMNLWPIKKGDPWHIEADVSPYIALKKAQQGWQKRGVVFKDEVVSFDKYDLILLDSAINKISDEQIDWLKKCTPKKSILATHVPLNNEDLIQFIDSNKGVNTKGMYNIDNQNFELAQDFPFIKKVVHGHCHFNGNVSINNTKYYFVSLSCKRPIENGVLFLDL